MQKQLNYKQDINYGVVSGIVCKPPRLSAEKGRLFWNLELKVKRNEKKHDFVKVIVPKDLMKGFQAPKIGGHYKFGGRVEGIFCDVNGKVRQAVCLKADKVKFCEHSNNKADINQVLVTGNLCRETTSKTSRAGVDIADNMVASNGKYMGDSTYFPVRALDGSAKILKMGKTGSTVCIRGCLSTRDYGTVPSGDHLQYYEVFANELELLDMSEYKKEVYDEGQALAAKV